MPQLQYVKVYGNDDVTDATAVNETVKKLILVRRLRLVWFSSLRELAVPPADGGNVHAAVDDGENVDQFPDTMERFAWQLLDLLAGLCIARSVIRAAFGR